MGNTIGKVFRLTTFGESHGEAIGGIIDGCPAGLTIDMEFIQKEIQRRKPSYAGATPRKESDEVQFLSGIFEGRTTGMPIAFQVENKNKKSEDYDKLKNVFRPSHADYTYQQKYGIRDHRGGGRSSARETLARVTGGAVAKLLLKNCGIEVFAYVSQIGKFKLSRNYNEIELNKIENFDFRFPEPQKVNQISEYIEKLAQKGDSIGGMITAVVRNCPVGLGEPVFDKLQADLAKAMLSINAAKGFEYGEGFNSASMQGSEHNDKFSVNRNEGIHTKTNHAGGILGGISSGEDICFNVAFKPIASIAKEQETIDVKGKAVKLSIGGRHDNLIVPRAVVIVEAMAALVLADHLLRSKISKT